MSAFLKIDGVHNFRDFGGYSAVNGTIKKGHLYRSGQFSNLTDEGIATLENLSPKTIIDLRRPNEKQTNPSNFRNLKLEIIENNEGELNRLSPHLEYLKEFDRDEASVFNYMLETYKNLPFEKRHKELFKASFEAIPKGTLIIHCAAGKDRTGIICALIHAALNVHNDDIFHDYLLTNKVDNLDLIIEKYADQVSKRIGRNISPKTMRPLGVVHESYLDAAFKEIIANNGSIINYLNSIGIGNQTLVDIERVLLDN